MLFRSDSQTPGALVPGTTTATALDEGALQALGLVREDLPRIAEIRLELDDLRPGNLQVFGREAATRTAAFSSQLLDQVRNRDLDASGEKLGEVVRIARSLKLDGFAQRSKVPVIGGLIDRMRASKGELVQKFSDTNAQIEQLLAEGDRALAAGRLSDADGSGARERYQAALALDGDRPQARQGLANTGAAALQQARDRLQADDLDGSAQALCVRTHVMR